MLSTRALVATALSVTLLGGAGATLGLRAQDATSPVAAPAASSAGRSATPTPAPERSPVLPPLPVDAAIPTAGGVAAAVNAALADPALAGRLAASVVDVATGQPVYERRAEEGLVPASTAKIATAVAALTALPPSTRLTTRVLAGAQPGEVVLVGGGDPLLASPQAGPGYPRAARLDELARQVRTALGGQPVRRVLVDDTLYTGPLLGPGWKPSYIADGHVAPVTALMVDGGRVRPGERRRSPDPALAAGRALGALLGARAEVARGTAPAGARQLGAVHSPPAAQLVEVMLTRSDNDLAEALARRVALARGRPASFDGAAAALHEVLGKVLSEAGADPAAVQLRDGSGLSRLSRVQPAALTRLLALVADGDAPGLAPMLSGLPVAGFDGTLQDRFREGQSTPAAGVVRGKTGTLSGVSALAGLLRTADGRLLAFDLAADAVPPGGTRAAERALDLLAARLAACGCT